MKRSSGSIKLGIWRDILFFFFLSNLNIIKLEKETTKMKRNYSHLGTVCSLPLLNILPVPSHLCIPSVLHTFPSRSIAVVSSRLFPGAGQGATGGSWGMRERERKKKKKNIWRERETQRSKDRRGACISPAQPYLNSKTLIRNTAPEPFENSAYSIQHQRLKPQQFPSIIHPRLAGSITQLKRQRQTEGVKLVISQLYSEQHGKYVNLYFILQIILTLRSKARDNTRVTKAVLANILKHRDRNIMQVVFQIIYQNTKWRVEQS